MCTLVNSVIYLMSLMNGNDVLILGQGKVMVLTFLPHAPLIICHNRTNLFIVV